MTGLNKDQDGYNFYDDRFMDKSYRGVQDFYNMQKHAMTTPSGIFTLTPTNAYGKPAFRFVEAKRGNNHAIRSLPAMFHIMPNSRMKSFVAGDRNKSFGCVNLPESTLDYMTAARAGNDTLYVLPTLPNNYIYESNENGYPLRTMYNTMPETITGKHYDKPYNLPVKYNTGY